MDSVFDEFIELHGDRAYADDSAIVGGIAKLNGRSLRYIVLSLQKNPIDS
jgi:acetyl-CoA carboxylase carboxyl transferase subunit alpha